MHNFLQKCISFLFPPSPDEVRVSSLTCDEVDALIYPEENDGIVSLLSYGNQNIRALIWQAKYRRDEKAFALLGSALREYLESLGEVVLIPIPLSRVRLRERGYNQSQEICRYAARELQCEVRNDVLLRIRHTKRQTELSRAERLKNLTDAFAAQKPDTLIGKHVVLIDDVTTTGTTLIEAGAALRRAGISPITLVALARAR